MNLSVLTSSNPRHHLAAHRSRDADGEAHVYLIHDAVTGWQRDGWEERARQGDRVYLCAYNLEKRGMNLPDGSSPVMPCGLSMLGRLLEAEDRNTPVLITHGPRPEALEEAERVFRGLKGTTDLPIHLAHKTDSDAQVQGRQLHFD